MSEDEQSSTFDSQLLGMTTIVECVWGNTKSQGSGFFYNDLAPKPSDQKCQQRRQIKGTWLITNRHVAFPIINNKEIVPNSFIFNLRQNNNGKIDWFPISLTREELIKRVKLHSNIDVDIVAIKIDDLLGEMIKTHNILSCGNITSDNLPSNSPLPIDVTSDIVIASYPRGYYDDFNKFPIVKSGIIASSWGSNFKGRPLFLIDAPLFPGSSGGVVISKPTNMALIQGNLSYNTIKQFVLLGVYSGEPVYTSKMVIDDLSITQNKSFGLGLVWYSTLIPEIINDGISHA